MEEKSKCKEIHPSSLNQNNLQQKKIHGVKEILCNVTIDPQTI